MTKICSLRIYIGSALILLLCACGMVDPNARNSPPVATADHAFPEYGVVQSMELLPPTDGRSVNPVVGNVYRYSVRMDNGTYRTLVQADNGSIRVGDLVRLENGMLMR